MIELKDTECLRLKGEKVRFLIVDDDLINIIAIQRAFRKLGLENESQSCHDGLEALDFLRKEDMCRKAPVVILLDINMPRMGGIAFLEALDQDSNLAHTSLTVLTTSELPIGTPKEVRRHISGSINKEDPSDSLRMALDRLKALEA